MGSPWRPHLFKQDELSMLENYKDDCHLLNAIKEGDESAFRIIYERYRKPLLIYALRFVDDEQVCFDLVHDAFISLWNKREQIIKDRQTISYLFTIVRTRSFNYLRDQRVKKKRETDLPIDAIQMPESKLEQSELSQLLTHAIASITSPASKRIFEMRYLEDMTFKEIAISRSISTNTVGVHLSNAVKFLRIKLKNYTKE